MTATTSKFRIDPSPASLCGSTAGRRIALGPGKSLNRVAATYAAETWETFAAADPSHWRRYFLEVMDEPSNAILFNLTQVDEWRQLAEAARRPGQTGDGVGWELLQIRGRSDWWPRITWYRDGRIVPNPFIEMN